jgi:hypothetical protein
LCLCSVFAAAGFLLLKLKSVFTPKAQSGGQDAIHFQLILADVERSLEEFSQMLQTQSRRTVPISRQDIAVIPMSPQRRRVHFEDSFEAIDAAVGAQSSSERVHCVEDALVAMENMDSSENTQITPRPVARVRLPLMTAHDEGGHSLFPLYDRQTWLARGSYLFNLVRLRSKFSELFEHVPVQAFSWVGGGSESALQTVSQYEVKTHKKFDDTLLFSRFRFACQSGLEILQAAYTLLFGSNELLSTTTQHRSLNKDILMLESPDDMVSLAVKLDTARRMRLSYKILSPAHNYR